MFLDAVEEFLSRVQLHVEVRRPWRSNLNTHTHTSNAAFILTIQCLEIIGVGYERKNSALKVEINSITGHEHNFRVCSVVMEVCVRSVFTHVPV